uniref:Ribosomal protein S1 n=1 Tax=Amphibolis griffithii TaxID=926552 RepID=A0A1Z1R0B5_9LILI|nr:ribosomal protein S1 [Amphibolis griffithii]
MRNPNRSFARSNSSFFSCNGKAFLSSVLRLRWRDKMFLVDAGLGTPIICLQNELTGVPINRATRFENKVGSLDVVAGEPLLLPRKLRQNRAWMELKKIWRTNKKVKGFRLEKIKGGYSVAIAGFITLIPFSTFYKKKIQNQNVRFTIARLHPKRQKIVVL